MVRQRSHCGFIRLLDQRGKVCCSRITVAIFGSTSMLLPNHCCHIWLNKYTVWVIVVQQRWITGSQINGGIQNSETQPLKQSRDVLHVRKIMMYQQPLHQQHIPQLHQGHFVTCKLITYRCPLVRKNWRFGNNRQVLKMGRSLSNRACYSYTYC